MEHCHYRVIANNGKSIFAVNHPTIETSNRMAGTYSGCGTPEMAAPPILVCVRSYQNSATGPVSSESLKLHGRKRRPFGRNTRATSPVWRFVV